MQIQTIPTDVLERAKKIKLLLLDVDGVLSDGKLHYGNNGEEIKSFNSLDGHGIKMLSKSGVEVGIITGRKSEIVRRRAAELNINLLLQGREDKLNALKEICQEKHFEWDTIAHVGDDLPDLPLISQVGLGITVANGHWVVKQQAIWQTQAQGGEGAVREVCDMIMLAQGSFDQQLTPYL